MDPKKINLIGMLPYKISEELFKQKIGTGDELKEFEDEGYLVKVGNLYELGSSAKPNYTKEEKEEFTLNLVDTYYQTKVDSINLDDFKSFAENYSIFNNLALHLLELGQADRSIETIFKMAKKMVYWGKGNDLSKWMLKFSQDNISKKNYLWKKYYEIFIEIVPSYRSKINFSAVDEIFQNYSKEDYDDAVLKIEMGNLEGIYYRIYKNDKEKAIEIHERYLKVIEEINDIEQKSLLKGRLLENLGFCYIGSNIDKAIEKLLEAEYFLKDANDQYELCKLYYYIVSISNKDDTKVEMNLTYLNLSMENLEKLRFPDIYRNVMSFFADMEITQNKNFNNYFKLKTSALDSARVLYQEYFIIDILSIVRTIKKNEQEYGTLIKDSMEPLIDFLRKVEDKEYYNFILAIHNYLDGKDFSENLKLVNSNNLKKQFFLNK